MALAPRGHEYPSQTTQVVRFTREFWGLFPQPPGWVEEDWPPLQLKYLGEYLTQLGCKTIIVESHYVDRDYISDVALFYSRSLRSYPNYCYRLHFFTGEFDQSRWRELIINSRADGGCQAREFLQRGYLGFSVVRPLPGAPVGRTVLTTPRAADAYACHFESVREYKVHLSCFDLRVCGLAFQQQDQGVSACATTALWSAIHRVAYMEGLPVATPAEITEAATRYFLPGGRSLPSEGLTVHQICEATRAAGLAPLLIRGVSPEDDRAQLFSYVMSGLAPLIAIQPLGTTQGHAVCAVGVKVGNVKPQTDPALHYRDASTAMEGVYIHDDRLGPYALADLYAHTVDSTIRTGFRIRWPDQETVEAEHSILTALIVPVPVKLRLPVTRMRALGMAIAEATGRRLLPQFNRGVTLSCVYRQATAYKKAAVKFGLTDDGLCRLACDTVLSRYIGVIEISGPPGALFDVLVDATESRANPAVLACVKRETLPVGDENKVRAIATRLGAQLVV